jgi:NAD(P)-dependent dehydrogenase (short-subunit alcohol dehydrogenase family)
MGDHQRVAIVTGGANGIGAAIVARLQRAGHAVASLDIEAASRARDGVLDLACDIRDPGAVSSAVSVVRSRLGAASVLVHCAAFQHVAPFAELAPADWRRTFEVNVDGAVHLMRAALPDLRERGWGRIVMITSSSYFAPPPAMSHYIASKGALTGLVRGLSVELGVDGITVNAVAPGLTRSENAVRNVPEEHFARVRDRQAIPRSGVPEDIAGAVAYLVSDDASFVTGQTLLVDGGESRL